MNEDVMSYLRIGVLFILSLFGFGMNVLIVLLFYRRRSVQTFSNRFVFSLSNCHILQCILIIPSYAVSDRKCIFGIKWCKAIDAITVAINLSIVFSILLIAIARNNAINNPLHYTANVTKKRANLLVSFIWLFSIILSIPTFLGVFRLDLISGKLWILERIPAVVYATTLILMGYVVPFISVSFLYIDMFIAARTTNARTRRSSCNSCVSNEVIINLKPEKIFDQIEYSLRRNFSSVHADPKRRGGWFSNQDKAAITGFIVVLSFVTCWSPYFLTLVYRQFKELTPEVMFWVQFAGNFSCILDPYIYFYRNKNMWRQTKKLLTLKGHQNTDFVAHSVAKKNQIDASRGVFRLPISFSQTVLSSQTSIKSSFSQHSIPENKAHKHIILSQDVSTHKKLGIFSVETAKSLFHQDSSSTDKISDV